MDDTFQPSTHLHFGAIIHISCFRDKTNFYIYSNGISFKNIIALAANQGPTQASMALFKITPSIKFQSQQFLQKLLKERYQTQQPIKISQEQIKVFIDQFEFELGQNNNLVQQQSKFPIKYNQDFMLQHLYSSKYLTYIKNQKTNQYILELIEIPTKFSIFNLDSCFNYQKDINTYIPFNSAGFLNLKIYVGLQIKDFYLNFKKESIFDTWVTSEEQKQQISIGLYQSAEQLEYKDLCYGDTVWIFHLQSSSFVKLFEPNEIESFILKKINFSLGRIKDGEEMKDQRAIIENVEADIFLHKTENQTSAEKYGLWKIIYAKQKQTTAINRRQHGDRFKGGKIRFDQEVRFYNIRHQVYLSIRKVKIGRNKFKYVLATQKNQEENTAFRIISLSPKSVYVTIEDLFLIQHVLSECYLTLGEPFKINQITANLIPSADYKKEDNFKFTKIEFSQQWENNNIMSILPFLREGIKVFAQNQGKINAREDVILQLLIQNLIELLSFSYDLTQGFEASSNKLGKITYNHSQIQKLLRQQGIISQLILLLSQINPRIIEKQAFSQIKDTFKIKGSLKIVKGFSAELSSQKKTIQIDSLKVRKIVNLCFKILRNCCKQNNQNSLLLFKEMGIFTKYLSLQTYTEQFFIDSFSKPIILEKFTGKQFDLIFLQYVKIFQRTKQYNGQIFKLLVNLIYCDQASFGKNQIEAYRLIFQQKNPITLPIIARNQRFQVVFSDQKYELKAFIERYPKQTSVLASQLNFFAYLTYDRNYVCSKKIKQIFPISLLLQYIKMDLYSDIKASLINIFTHSYLNQRPRYIKKTQKVYPLYNIKTKQTFKNSLQSRNRLKSKEMMRRDYQYQLKEMQISGISQNGINDIMSCIYQKDYIEQEQLNSYSKWLIKYISESCEKNDQRFYNCDVESSLTSLKYLIELGLFEVQDNEKITSLIKNIVKRIGQSLQLQNQMKITLKSDNFKSLLLEMMEKNIIKRFNYSAKFDGLQDQVGPQNICSQYVNYAFYQNILLLEKNSQSRRKQSVKVIVSVLKLISMYNDLFVQEKIEQCLGQIVQMETQLKNNTKRHALLQDMLTKKILKETMNGRSQIIRLLLLLFYNNNSFNINYASIQLLSNQLYTQNKIVQSLGKLIFITQKQEQEKYEKMNAIYKEIRLLTQTSQVWLNSNYQSINFQYNSVILYFIDRVRAILKLVVPNFRQERWVPFDCVAGLQHDNNLQRQIILSNIDCEQQIMNILKNYRHYLTPIKVITKSNYLFIRLMKYCLLFLYTFIYSCPENKQKMTNHLQEVSVSEYFLKFSNIQIGQSRFLVEYLKDNYQQCIDFYSRYNQTLNKFNKYSETYSSLFLILLKYNNEPIQANLKKFFINIFDLNSFKDFLWLKDGKQFQLNLKLLIQIDQQPYFYQINAIDAVIYLYDNLGQSMGTLKNHIRKCFTVDYLFSLLNAQDYFNKQNSLRALMKIQILFKARILKLIQKFYVQDGSDFILKQLQKYKTILNMFIDESIVRQQTDDYRKTIILKDAKQQPVAPYDYRLTQLYTVTYGEVKLIEVYLQFILKFAESVKKAENCKNYHSLAQTVMQQVLQILQILHTAQKLKKQKLVYPIPNQLNFKPINPKNTTQFARKKYFMSAILESIYSEVVYKKILENKIKSVGILKQLLQDINLKQFLFYRKISQFLQDAFQKLPQDSTQTINFTLRRFFGILTLFITSQKTDKASQIRQLMGKSELVFPILNYYETAVLDVPNRRLFLVCLIYINQLLGSDGNRSIQTIFNSYFTNKTDSIDFFMKIKQILNEINIQQAAQYKCRRLADGIQSFYNGVSGEKESVFIILNFFINLCKGNFTPNQTYLGKLSTTSNFNITRSIWQILKNQSQKYKNSLVNVQNYYRITQCLSTIRQFVQGPCVQNQNEFLKRDFFLTVLQYLQYEGNQSNLELQQQLQEQLTEISNVSKKVSEELRVYLNQDKITKQWMPSQVKYRCISLISSLMTENVNQKSTSELLTIPHELLKNQLDKVYKRYQQLSLQYKRQNLQFSQENQVVLPLGFKIYEVLQYYPKKVLQKSTPGLQFFKQNSRIVQVLHQNLTIVVFPKIETQISQAFKAEFLENADRTSINSKLRDLQNAQIQNRQSDYPYGYIVFFLTILLIFLDLLIYSSNELEFVQNLQFYSIFIAYGNDIGKQMARAVILLAIVVFSAFFLFLQIKGAVYMRQTIENIMKSDAKSFQKFKVIGALFLQNLDYLHYFYVMLLAALGIFNPLFDSLVLILELFRRSQTFFIIFKAIKQTMDQLCVVLLINLILTYILASILYFYYGSRNDYSANCGTLYYCFTFALSIGFKTDAGFVGQYDTDYFDKNYATVSFWDVLVNFCYLFIIKVIMDQVIGAIIVDKFAQIRQQKQSLEEDQNSVCFICGIERNILDREEDGFQKHKEQYHVIWNYMQFLIHIKQSKLGNLTGIERFVYDQHKNGKLNWFPINRSFHLQNKKKSEENEAGDKQNQIQKLTKMLDTEVVDINQQLNYMQDIINIKALKDKKKDEK